MVSQPQNSEFRNNPENFHPCLWASLPENMILLHTNIKGGDQPAHPCSLIGIFINHSLEGIVAKLATCDISIGESSNFPNPELLK